MREDVDDFDSCKTLPKVKIGMALPDAVEELQAHTFLSLVVPFRYDYNVRVSRGRKG